jgi:hypothetical protein
MTAKNKKPKRAPEIPVTLDLWFADGAVMTGDVDFSNRTRRRVPRARWPLVSIGRTDSKRRLGFAIKMRPRAGHEPPPLPRNPSPTVERSLPVRLEFQIPNIPDEAAATRVREAVHGAARAAGIDPETKAFESGKPTLWVSPWSWTSAWGWLGVGIHRATATQVEAFLAALRAAGVTDLD